ncbi:TPA: hypothetical protein ACXE8V_004813 [Pluralibacter gergoviae]
MIEKKQAVEVAKSFARSRHGTWDDNNNSAIKVNFEHEPCWKVSVISGNETGAEWFEIVSGTPIDYYVSMTTGELIGYRIARGEVSKCSYKL